MIFCEKKSYFSLKFISFWKLKKNLQVEHYKMKTNSIFLVYVLNLKIGSDNYRGTLNKGLTIYLIYRFSYFVNKKTMKLIQWFNFLPFYTTSLVVLQLNLSVTYRKTVFNVPETLSGTQHFLSQNITIKT